MGHRVTSHHAGPVLRGIRGSPDLFLCGPKKKKKKNSSLFHKIITSFIPALCEKTPKTTQINKSQKMGGGGGLAKTERQSIRSQEVDTTRTLGVCSIRQILSFQKLFFQNLHHEEKKILAKLFFFLKGRSSLRVTPSAQHGARSSPVTTELRFFLKYIYILELCLHFYIQLEKQKKRGNLKKNETSSGEDGGSCRIGFTAAGEVRIETWGAAPKCAAW